jgi:hypothetical protein
MVFPTKNSKPVPEPIRTEEVMREGRKFKLHVLPGYKGQAAPLPDSPSDNLKIGTREINGEGRLIDLRKQAEY